jgi:Lon protease-like protein
MFPLGTVLFPTELLPLHVFEPRYRTMVKHCLAGNAEFGVVLIERGSDVGGGDVRTDVGTVARLLEVDELDDGRYLLATVGTRRIRVERWLDDRPFPRADVAEFDEPASAPPPDGDRYAETRALLRRVLALHAELGETVTAATVELTDDPVLGSFQAAAVAPVGTMDKHRLLSLPSAAERLAALHRLLTEEAEVLAQRLRLG